MARLMTVFHVSGCACSASMAAAFAATGDSSPARAGLPPAPRESLGAAASCSILTSVYAIYDDGRPRRESAYDDPQIVSMDLHRRRFGPARGRRRRRLTAQTRPAVARLDGMPLAIELAAARVEALGVTQLMDRVDDRFGLLTGGDRLAAGRQWSLAATVEWSYRLL